MYYQTSCRTLSCLLLPKSSFTWGKHCEKCGFLAWMQIPIFSVGEPHKILDHIQNNCSCCVSKVLGRSVTTVVCILPLSQALSSFLQLIFSVSVGILVKTYIDTGLNVGMINLSGLCTVTLNLQHSAGSNFLCSEDSNKEAGGPSSPLSQSQAFLDSPSVPQEWHTNISAVSSRVIGNRRV